MLKTLIRVRLRGLLDSMLNRRRGKAGTDGKKRLLLLAIVAIYCIAVFGFLFGSMFYIMREPFAMLGMDWLYFSMAAIMATMLCFFGSVFMTQSLIYEAKDNELLLSMPVRPSAIVGSRIIILLLLNMGFSLIILLPCGIVACMTGAVTVSGVITYAVCALLLPLLPSVLSCILGGVIALVTSRMRNKNIFSLILSLVFLGAYFTVCFNMQSYITKLVDNGAAIGAAVEKALPPFYAFGVAISEGNILQMLHFAAWCVIPFAIAVLLLARSFITIATAKRGASKPVYHAKRLQSSSVRWAMTKKELRRLLSSSSYMLNGCLGAVMAVAIAVLCAVKGKGILQSVANIYAGGADVTSFIMPFACLIECLTLSINIISAPSLSLEGKSFWLLQSAPVNAGDVLLPKAYMHMLIAMPAGLIASLIFVLVLPMTVPEIVLIFILPQALTAFMALFGVVMNLRFPRFDYSNETAVIKQSTSVTVTMFTGMGIVLLPMLLYILVLRKFMSVMTLMIIAAALLIAASAVLYDHLAHRSQAAYDALNQGG